MPVEVVTYRLPPIDPSILTQYEKVPTAGIMKNGDLLAAFLEANSRLGQCAADKVELAKLLEQ